MSINVQFFARFVQIFLQPRCGFSTYQDEALIRIESQSEIYNHLLSFLQEVLALYFPERSL